MAPPLGTLGQSPSGGAALYFEVRIDGRPVDPLQWLQQREELSMKIRGRVLVLAVSMAVIAFAVVGGFMSKAIAREDSYQYLRIFEDVVSLILNNYVEDVNVDKVMHGAMHGLADGLDPDSAYLDAAQVKVFEKGDLGGTAQTGLELTRQYYLRVIAARDGSPAAKAGLMPGDYIRAIDGQSTRDTTSMKASGCCAASPAPRCTSRCCAATPPNRTRSTWCAKSCRPSPVKSRIAAPGVGYLRIAEFGKGTADQIKSEVVVAREGRREEPDHRRARHGVRRRGRGPRGGAAVRQERRARLSPGSRPGEGSGVGGRRRWRDHDHHASCSPTTARRAAPKCLRRRSSGNKRATLIGERTLGRAARQKLVRLPDGSALMLTHLLYLTPASVAIHEKGLMPDVAVEQPDVDFGQPPPAKDATLDKAIEQLTLKAAA